MCELVETQLWKCLEASMDLSPVQIPQIRSWCQGLSQGMGVTITLTPTRPSSPGLIPDKPVSSCPIPLGAWLDVLDSPEPFPAL